MLTYLQLCQRTGQEAGIPGTVPATVISQVGELRRICNWVASAWLDIQAEHQDWRFLRQSVSFLTVNGQATYTTTQAGATTFSRWIRQSFRVYTTATGTSSETPLTYVPYEVWRDTYQFGAMRTSYQRPNSITITPDRSLGLGPVPLVGYTIVGDYYSAPVLLANDNDIPTLPDSHNPMLIVNRALMAYGAYQSAPEVYQQAKGEYDRMYGRLTYDQLPEVLFGGALA